MCKFVIENLSPIKCHYFHIFIKRKKNYVSNIKYWKKYLKFYFDNIRIYQNVENMKKSYGRKNGNKNKMINYLERDANQSQLGVFPELH